MVVVVLKLASAFFCEAYLVDEEPYPERTKSDSKDSSRAVDTGSDRKSRGIKELLGSVITLSSSTHSESKDDALVHESLHKGGQCPRSDRKVFHKLTVIIKPLTGREVEGRGSRSPLRHLQSA